MITKAQGIVICGGDFNRRLNPKLDASIIDYTFSSPPHKTYSRIDYFFMYSKDVGFVRSCKIGLLDLSDHSPIYLDINLKNSKHAFSWKLNTNVLKGKVKEELQLDILLYVSENDNGEVSPLMVWDASKAVLRGKIIAKLALQRRLKQEKLNKLEKELENLEKKHKKYIEAEISERISKIKKQIAEIYDADIQKKLVFLKQRYYEVGNKAQKILAYKLRKQQAERVINKTKDPVSKQIKYKCQDIHNSFEILPKTLSPNGQKRG